MARLLLVEDDPSLGRTLSERLSRDGHEVIWATSVESARERFADGGWDLAVVDVMLPDGSGFGLARQFRRTSNVPFMFMTALNSAENRLEGFEIGASEYLPKPFHLKEFLLRIRHVLATNPVRRTAQAHGRVVDFDALTVALPDGRVNRLQLRDCRVLKMLVDAIPRVVERSEILDRVWGEDRFPTPRAVDNSIVRLRQALADDDGDLIVSVRGIGYRWAGEASA